MDVNSFLATRKQWPFKLMQVGEIKILKSSEVNLNKAAAAVRAYAHGSGKVFLTRKREVEGELWLRVKRAEDPELAAQSTAVDGRSLRRKVYGFEHLEVGESIEIVDLIEARRAVSGITGRQKETGKRWTSRREPRTICEGGMAINSEVMTIKRVK